MTYDCELIQDLLPLYGEDLCSSASRRAVEAHLLGCECCRRLAAPLSIEPLEDSPAADMAVKRSMRKVRRRWLAFLLAAALLFPLLLMGFNQYRGWGLSFTNLDDVYTAWQFLHALETKNWEKAAGLHDFSQAYGSILDALAQEPAAWGTSLTPFTLAGYDYAGHTYLDRTGDLPETASELYGYLYNRTGTAMVPVALWQELMALAPDAFSQQGSEYWLNDERYGKITTDWGDFVVSEGRSFETAYDYCIYFDLVPAAIYAEARPELEAEALRVYSNTHADIGWVAELTEDEFTEEMTRRYISDLRTLSETVTLDCTGYRSIGSYGDTMDGSCVFFNITVIQNEKSVTAEIQINVEAGRIRVAGISHHPDTPWLDAIDRALYPSAHTGY